MRSVLHEKLYDIDSEMTKYVLIHHVKEAALKVKSYKVRALPTKTNILFYKWDRNMLGLFVE